MYSWDKSWPESTLSIERTILKWYVVTKKSLKLLMSGSIKYTTFMFELEVTETFLCTVNKLWHSNVLKDILVFHLGK